MVICGQEFEFSLMNANDLDRFEDANERMQRRNAEEAEKFQRGGVRLGDHARAQARIAMDCIDEILGAGASDRLGLNENYMAPIHCQRPQDQNNRLRYQYRQNLHSGIQIRHCCHSLHRLD